MPDPESVPFQLKLNEVGEDAGSAATLLAGAGHGIDIIAGIDGRVVVEDDRGVGRDRRPGG